MRRAARSVPQQEAGAGGAQAAGTGPGVPLSTPIFNPHRLCFRHFLGAPYPSWMWGASESLLPCSVPGEGPAWVALTQVSAALRPNGEAPPGQQAGLGSGTLAPQPVPWCRGPCALHTGDEGRCPPGMQGVQFTAGACRGREAVRFVTGTCVTGTWG